MSKINFQLYGDQIYGLSSKYLQEYIKPEINKESFLTSFKNGLMDINISGLKKQINIFPHLIIKDLNSEKIIIDIPDENSNLSLKISKLKLMLIVKELTEEEILSLLITKRQKLVKKFIKEAIKSIEKKSKSGFLEGLLDNLLNSAINGLKIELNDIEIYLKCNNFLFLLKIENVFYNENEGIKINNINIIFNDANNTQNKCDIIKNLNANINIKGSKDINNESNELKINLMNFSIEINNNVFNGVMNVVQIFQDVNYKLVLFRYKKLIDLNKPKKNVNDKKEYYKSLWFWAIKTVIKLQKYKSHEKLYIFDLIPTSQTKYAKKYIKELNKDFDVNDNFKECECIILPEEINLLKETKEKVENQVLDNKKGNQLANAFNFLFGGGGNDNKNELTEEEKQCIDEIYSDEGIIKFLTNKKGIKENNSNEEKTLDKIKNFFNKISYNIIINKIELLLNNFFSKYLIYLQDINFIFDINRYNKTKNYLFELADIGYGFKNTFFKDKIDENNKMIKFTKKLDIYEINFGFKNFEIDEKIILFLVNFYYSLYYKSGLNSNRNKFFIKTKYKNKKTEEQNVFNIIDKIKIINIPGINFISKNDNLCLSLNLNDFSINKTSINFGINIKDNNENIIIDNYQIKIEKNEENTKFEIDLTNKLNIAFPSQITKKIFSFFFQIKKLNQYYQIIDHINSHSKADKENNILLYSFHYKIYKTLKVEKSFLEKIKLKFGIKYIILVFHENSYKTNISIANLTLTYGSNRNLLFKLGTISLSTYKLSTLFLLMIKLKNPEFDKYETFINDKIKNEFDINMKDDILNQNVKTLKDADPIDFVFQNYHGKLINQLIDICKIYITEIKINFRSEDNIFSLILNRTFGEKAQNFFKFKTESILLNYLNAKDMKNIKNIIEIKDKTNTDYDFMKKNFILKTKNPKIEINDSLVKTIKESFELKIDKKRLKGILKRNEAFAELSNINILFDKFDFNIENAIIKNNANFTTNSIFVTLSKFIMKRSDIKNGIILMKEKEFKLSYEPKGKTNKLIKIKSNGLNIMTSQEDLYFLILYISNIYFDTKSPEKKNKSSNKKIVSSIYQINNIEVDFELPMINLLFCRNNNYKKIVELLLINTLFEIKSFYNENINNKAIKEYIKQTDYSILINKTLLKYIDINNNETTLLRNGIDNNNQKINHIEIFIKKKEEIIININKNYIVLTGDSFYSLYHYFKKAIPLDQIRAKSKSGNDGDKLSKITSLQFNFDYVKLFIPFSFDAKENLCFQIEKFIIIFNSINQSKFPLGNFGIKLSSISCFILSNNIARKLFYTNKEFLSLRMKYLGKNLDLMVNLETFIMNLSYTDIATFLQVYYLNKILIEKEKKLINQGQNANELDSNNIDNNNIQRSFSYNYVQDIIEKSVLFSGNFHFENFNITLIDNSSGSYYPFAKLELTSINLDCKQDNSISSYFSLLLLSYNYISCVWEPTIEKAFIQFFHKEENQSKSHNFQIDLNNMNINISDMSISFTLSSLDNWIKKLIEDQKNLKNSTKGLENNNLNDLKRSSTLSKNELKVTNNKLINNTGVKLYIQYANKAYSCDPYEQLELEYINEWDPNKFGPKQISLSLDSNKSYFIPIEKICTRKHQINNVLYIVSENILSKERQININIHSPIIFKNKSLYQLQLNIFNPIKGNAQYFLEKNSVFGLPLFYYEPNTYFNLNLIDSMNNQNSTSNNYRIDEIVNYNKSNNNGQTYKKNIIIGNTILFMNLAYKIPDVKSILIGCEYMIINCLPCNIGLTAKNNNYIIEKCSQQYIDFYSGNDEEIGIQITANNTTYFSRPKRLFQKEPKETGNFLKFRNSNNNETFRLSLFIKKKENKKIIIIYAESILDNKSGIDFYIKSNNICFSLTKNLYLISSKVNIKESYFTLNNDYYKHYSKSIFFKDIIHSSPSYFLDLKTYSNSHSKKNLKNYPSNQIQLIIDNTMSYINLKNSNISKYNIITMIYRIYSLYRFTNLLPNKSFIIASQENPGEYTIIEPMSQHYFDFFHRGQNAPLIFGINSGDLNYTKFTSGFRPLQIGTYTFTVGNNLFNLDIKKTSTKGIVDVFITETNFNNAKIIVDNLTTNIFNIVQRNYESYNQIIEGNKKEILNIYDQNFMKFILQYGNQNPIGFEFIPSEIQEKQIELGNNMVMWLESNGIKMKISFFYKNILEQNLNFSLNKSYNFSIKINEVLVSLIGDNEPKSKNLRNYERKEILLLDMNELYLEIKLNENQGLLRKDVLKTFLSFSNICLYNQSKTNLKFINALYNEYSPCIGLSNEIYHFKNDNVWIIKGFALNLANLTFNIDPVFVEEIMDFIKNIIYRMKIKNYNVDKIFLTNENENQGNYNNSNIHQEKMKEYKKIYSEKSLTFHGTNFQLPKLEIVFQISKLGLEHLLINKFAFSSFFIWTAKGLIGRQHSIKLEPYTIQLYIGGFKGILKKIIQRYKKAVVSELVTIGIKGVIGNISKVVGKKVLKFLNALNNNQNDNNFFMEEDENINNNMAMNNQFERRRIQRAFYGKFKYFREFNQDHAYYFDLIPKKLSNYNINFIFIDLLRGNNNNLYVFTNMSLILMSTYMEIYKEIYYFYIEEVILDKNVVYIRYNQNIDGNSFFQFKEKNEMLAQKVAEKLDYFSKNKDDFNDA